MLQLSRAALVLLAQAFFAQRTALTVLFVCQIQPVQPTGTAVERIQVQQLAVGTDIGVQAFIILKCLPFQLHIGAVMIRLGADEELDLQFFQCLMGQRKVIGGIRRRGLNGQNIPVNPLHLFQIRHRVIDIPDVTVTSKMMPRSVSTVW